jgi:hypothetical protein
MNQGPRCDSLMKKIGGQKSHGTIPLNNLFWQKNAPNLEFGEGGTPQIKVYC